jgi:hypothetical protein
VARTLLILLGLLFGLPLVLSACLMVGGSTYAAYYVFQMMNLVEKGPAPPVKQEWNVVNVGRGSNNVDGYELLVNRERLLEGRRVEITASASRDDLEDASGLQLSSTDSGSAALAAPKIAQAECAIILAAFAEKCIVHKAQISPTKSANILSLEIVLLFVEREPLGNVQKDSELSFIESSASLNRQGARDLRIDRRGQTAARKNFYREAVETCRRNRAVHGNCAIQSIKISSRADATGYMVNVTGRADFAILQAQKS